MAENFPGWHGTTIIGVRKGGEVVIAGDGQVSLGQTVIKGTARKVRRLSPGGFEIVAGFAGSTADASLCSTASKPSSRPHPASSSGPASSSRRTGGPTSTFRNSRPSSS